jgi:GT2 family glycosyltransferase
MSTNSPRVIIILLNYNGAEDTIACLQSLREIIYPNYNIVIVDNDSPDRSMEVIGCYLSAECVDHVVYNRPGNDMEYAGKLSFVTCIQSGRNGGYGYGNNIGIKYALANSADYVLALNNDTVVDPGFLEPLVAMCEADANIGIASARIYFHDRPDVIWFNGGRFHPYTAKVEHVNFNDKDIGQKSPAENTFISGCLWLVPRKVFETVGFINEEYFMYVEDLEYCQRVLNQGYTLRVCEKSKLWHKVGNASGGHLSKFSAYWTARNQFKFYCSNMSGFYKIIPLLNLTVIKPLKFFKIKKSNLIPIHFKGIFDAIRG